MDLEDRVDRVTRHTVEVLTREETKSLLATHDRPTAYIGFEPSGSLTVAHLITARKMIDLQEAGCELTVFLADWHAWINDKLGGDLARIEAAGRAMADSFLALGVNASTARIRWSHELVGRAEYWARVIRVAKATSLDRTKRAMTIMGRGEEESKLDSGKLFYPSMQVADIFELPVDIAYGGTDQRRAHVLARETAHHYGWTPPVAVHTPLLASLKGGGRMDPEDGTTERKMSKSDPSSGIPITADRALIEARIGGAFCPAKETEGNPVVETVRYIAFPWEGRFTVDRAEKHGGPIAFETVEQFLGDWKEGKLHPQDLKRGVVDALDRILTPVRRAVGGATTANTGS
jgi:tyrosyl-tRNA synthetase